MNVEQNGLNTEDVITPRISGIKRRLPMVVFLTGVGISGSDLNGKDFSPEQQIDMIGGNLSMARQMLTEAQRIGLPLDAALVAKINHLSQVFGPIADKYEELARSNSRKAS